MQWSRFLWQRSLWLVHAAHAGGLQSLYVCICILKACTCAGSSQAAKCPQPAPRLLPLCIAAGAQAVPRVSQAAALRVQAVPGLMCGSAGAPAGRRVCAQHAVEQHDSTTPEVSPKVLHSRPSHPSLYCCRPSILTTCPCSAAKCMAGKPPDLVSPCPPLTPLCAVLHDPPL